jgi:iron(III) transport system substrate-binding protein
LLSIARRLAVVVMSCVATVAFAQGEINVFCNVPLPWCEAMTAAFAKETGIRVRLTQKGAVDSLAQITAERADPKHDVWYAGAGDAHLQAADLGLTDEHKSPLLPQLYDWAVRQAEQSKFRTVGIYTAVLGIGYNTDALAKKGLPEPKCWTDLARPEYRGEIQMTNPTASPSAYATIPTLVQIFGEDKAFELLKAVHRNTNGYPRTATGAIRAAARSETTIAVTFLHEAVTEIVNGFPIKLVVPCEGTGYELGSISIIKGAPNPENARKFYEWALTPAAQRIGPDMKHFQMPSNKATPIPPEAPKMSDVSLIAYDFAKYGSASERTRLLEKWDREVFASPR